MDTARPATRSRAMKTRWQRRALLLGAVAAGAVACSLFVPLDEQQCTAASDCAARGSAFAGATCVNNVCVAGGGGSRTDASGPIDAGAGDDGGGADPWGCLDDPPEVTDPKAQVAITFTVFDALSPITTAGPTGGSDFTIVSIDPVPGVTLAICEALDPTCARPVMTPIVTDDAGAGTVVVPQTFDGFFTFDHPGFLPSKLYPGRVLADASTFAPPVAFLGTQETSLLAKALGVTMALDPDAGVGHAFFQVYDCFDRHGVGVTFSVNIDGGPDAVHWYTKNELPSTTTTVTDSLGAGGVVNVPAGALTLTATLAATQRQLGSVNTVITAGGTTFAFVRVRSH